MTTKNGASADSDDGRAEALSSFKADSAAADPTPDAGAPSGAALDPNLDPNLDPGRSPPADPPPALSVMPRRRDFLAAARAQRWNAPGLVVQARLRGPDEPAATPARVGYTCSKKVGNAIRRNRAKRRLRAAAAEALAPRARAGWDYVLIGRAGATEDRPFAALVADLAAAVDKLHAGKGKTGGPPRRKGRK